MLIIKSIGTERGMEKEMTLILEYRDKIKKFYRANAVIILPILRFLIAFIALNGVNTMMGYMPRIDTVTIVLIASLACSFLPAGCLVLLCTLFSLAHMYALSLEVLLVGLGFFVLIYLLMLRFAPSDSYVVVLTPLFFAMKMPYVIPIAVGLVCSPLSAISVAVGVIVYYVLGTIVNCAPSISAMDDKDITGKILFLMDNLLKNKAMLIIAFSFAVTVVIVWAIHRMSIEHSWTIAMTAGAMVNLGLLLIGDLKYDIGLSLGSAILGSILAILVAKVIEFFRFCVDYGRTERVQFEDDEYYYYVKAVPKMVVAAPTKTVKKINVNTNTQSMPAVGERVRKDGKKTVAQTKTSGQGKSTRTQGTSERTARPRADLAKTQALQTIRGTRTGQKAGTGVSAVQENYGTQSYDTQSYDAQSYDTQGYDAQSYDTQGYDAQSYDAQNGYGISEGYDDQSAYDDAQVYGSADNASYEQYEESYETAEELGQTKTIPLAWNAGQANDKGRGNGTKKKPAADTDDYEELF